MAGRLAYSLGWPLDVVKRHTLRDIMVMSQVLEEVNRKRRIAQAHQRARKGR